MLPVEMNTWWWMAAQTVPFCVISVQTAGILMNLTGFVLSELRYLKKVRVCDSVQCFVFINVTVFVTLHPAEKTNICWLGLF